MADADVPVGGQQAEVPKKKGRKGLIVGLVLAVLLGGGGFYAVYSGVLLGPHKERAAADAAQGQAISALPPVAFVALEPLVISLGSGARNQHLRFRAELEVVPGAEGDVAKLTPRVMDVLNSYLRAVAIGDLEDPAALINLRAQMLRRIQLVIGEGRVRDLLIMEFVLN